MLTAAGQALHRHTQWILSDVDLLAADLSDYASGIVGVVRLWANTSSVTQFLPHELALLLQGRPGGRIKKRQFWMEKCIQGGLEIRSGVVPKNCGRSKLEIRRLLTNRVEL
jgi:DNA-binding transcriptional LysR family regulator